MSGREFISPAQVLEMFREAGDAPAAHRLAGNLFRRMLPLLRNKSISHATMILGLGELMAAVIEASEPGNPEMALMAAVGIYQATLSVIEEKKVGGVRQEGHA